MRMLLFLLSVCAVIAGFGAFAVAKSAIHEIYGALFLLIGAVFFAAAAVCEQLMAIRKALRQIAESNEDAARSTRRLAEEAGEAMRT